MRAGFESLLRARLRARNIRNAAGRRASDNVQAAHLVCHWMPDPRRSRSNRKKVVPAIEETELNADWAAQLT
jgi:hypothetical protein